MYFYCINIFLLKLYGSAISLPSNNLGVATFDNIGIFDLPNGAVFQVDFFHIFYCCMSYQFHIENMSAGHNARLRLFLHSLPMCLMPFGAILRWFP